MSNWTDKQGYFIPNDTGWRFDLKEADLRIYNEGVRFERIKKGEVYPHGGYLIYRKYDGKIIGRCEKEQFTHEGVVRWGWKGRFYYFGGGSTYGTFRTRKDASDFVLKSNVVLSEGWDL